MSELLLMFGEDGKAHMYNSDFDVTIHCEDEQQMNEAVELLNLANRMHWRNTAVKRPTKDDADASGYVLSCNALVGEHHATSCLWTSVAANPNVFPVWMPMPNMPGAHHDGD